MNEMIGSKWWCPKSGDTFLRIYGLEASSLVKYPYEVYCLN